ncbi:MAG: nucleoid-associated protein [Thiomicrospira sp.]
MEIGESIVSSVILHKVGNRLREEPLVLADNCFSVTSNISNLILGGFLRGIVNSKNQYLLSHESDMALNDIAYHVSSFFSKKDTFIQLSEKLARHLYACAHHPNIASGDLFIILFDNLKVGDTYKSAIGIYKAESKQQYLSTEMNGKIHKLEVSTGINPDLIDKGALIVEGSEIIYAVDRVSSRTKYWIDDFLKAKQIPNETIKSAIAVDLIEKVSRNIENPVERQKFSKEVVNLCSVTDAVRSEDIKDISLQYVSSDILVGELDRIVERKGLVNFDDFSISTKRLKAKLKKVFNRINLGNDIALIIPEGLLFSNVHFNTDHQSVTITVILEKSNG